MQNNLKIIIKILISSFIATNFAAAAPIDFTSLQNDITADKSMHIGMQVLDPQTGNTLYQYQAEQYFHPASNAKLFTSIAAMLSLGANYKFSTRLITNQTITSSIIPGNLYIKFGGDPSLTSADLNNLLSNLQQKGVKTIKGDVILDNTIFKANSFALGEIREDSMWAFGAPATSIIIDENSAWVTFKPNTPKPEITKVDPSFIKVSTNMVWQNDSNKEYCSFQATSTSGNSIQLAGCMPPELGSTIGLALPDPNIYAEYLVRQDLNAYGITLNGKILTGTTPKSANIIIAQHDSATLSVLMTKMLQISDNIYASAIAKTMGLKRYGIGTDKVGAAAIMDYLAPYQLPNYKFEDGDGGSYYTLVTPSVMTQLLYHAYQNPELKNFLLSALPEVSVDGTLEDFPSQLLKGKVIAKTGTMTDTSSLSGFITTKQNHTLIFSLLIDSTPQPNKDLKRYESKILTDLYNAD